MSKILIIPDVHHHKQLLRIWDKYEKAVDYVVLLGDFFDDFLVQESDMKAYTDMYEAISKRLKRQGNKIKICAGNHELSYTWDSPVTGNSELCRSAIRCLTSSLYTESRPIIKIDHCIFSHAGVTNDWLKTYYSRANLSNLEAFFDKVKDDFWFGKNKREIFWNDDSPLWVRPNFSPSAFEESDMYQGNQYFKFKDCWQFVGHTPTEDIIRDNEQRIVFLDVFAALSLEYNETTDTYVPDKYGCQKAIIVDSETCEILREVK